ncbi:MAG: hypothetical protein AAGD13_17950 [Pseudomonadota bacterium]
MRRIRAAAAAVTMIALAGCGAQVFEKETASFASSASGVEQVWVQLYDRIDASAQAERDRVRIREGWDFNLSPRCGRLSRDLTEPLPDATDKDARKAEIERRNQLLESCALTERRAGLAPADARPVSVKKFDRSLLTYASSITAYGSALANLTEAEDQDALRTAASDMADSLTKAGEKLRDRAELDIDVAGPISALASLYAEARIASFERAKYRTLVDVVEGSNGAIQRMTQRLAEVEPELRADLLDAQSDAVRQAVRDLRNLPRNASRAERERRQSAAIARMAEYKAYASTLVGGGASYADVGRAHQALADAIADPDNFELAKNAAENLKGLGEAVKDAANAFGANL